MFITNPSSLKKYHAEHRIWQGIPGIEHTKNGRTFVSFYSGNTKETYGNYAVVIMSDDEIPAELKVKLYKMIREAQK